MNCAFHPEGPVAGYCTTCGRALCETCLGAAQRGGCQACRPQATAPRVPVGLLIGLGVAVVALVIAGAVIGGILTARAMYETTVSAPSPSSPPAATVPSPPDAAGMRRAAPSEEDDATVPGEAAARAFALSRSPDSAVTIPYHTDDWRSAHVVIGPTRGDWTTFLDIVWDDSAGAYVLEDEGPIVEESIPESEKAPEIYRPGEQVAKEAALVGHEDWVAKVVQHSPDWKSVTVWIGPPHSEFIWATKLRWDNSQDCYDVIAADPVGG